MQKPLVGVIMGSDSDMVIMQDSIAILKEFKIPFEVNIISAHRTPDRMVEYAKNAYKKGLKVIIAGAGGAAHLPGMTASFTSLPVIGVPINTKSFDGFDSLLSIIQMPNGIPVATVAINGSKNAGILAVSLLALHDNELYKKLEIYKDNLKNKVILMDESLIHT